MIVGTVFRGGDWIDGVLRSDITKDGLDATDVICSMITEEQTLWPDKGGYARWNHLRRL